MHRIPVLTLHLFICHCIATSLDAGFVSLSQYVVQRQKTSPLKAINGQRSLLPMKRSVRQQDFGDVLLLVEEVDVILDADRGFHSAVVNLMKTTKVGCSLLCVAWWLLMGSTFTHCQARVAALDSMPGMWQAAAELWPAQHAAQHQCKMQQQPACRRQGGLPITGVAASGQSPFCAATHHHDCQRYRACNGSQQASHDCGHAGAPGA